MGRFAAALVAAFVLLAGCKEEVAAPQTPAATLPELTGRVVDQADLLSPAQEAALSTASSAVERDVGPQFVIATVATLQGLSIDQYGVQLGRGWRIGDKDRNDGVLLIVAPNERKVRIEVGYGLEKRVTDPFAAKVIREEVLPRFQIGDFPGGIEAGSRAITGRLRSTASDAEIADADGLVI